MQHYKRKHDVTIYTTPGSRNCDLVKVYFKEKDIEVKEIDVFRDPSVKKKLVEISEQDKTPVTVIDGRVIVGYHPDVYNLILEGRPDF
jgi:arsenate reductase-like glutaredoxin family protein